MPTVATKRLCVTMQLCMDL